MTLKEQIMKLQTYKMFEGEDTVYVERDDVLKAIEQQPCDDWKFYYKHGYAQARNDVLDKIRAEIEPCEDCISRTEALKVIEQQKKGFYGVERYAIDECHSAVMKLPSVVPQPKVGKWIVVREQYEFMGGVVNEPRGCKCSNCNKVVRFKSKYCPNCGSKMEVDGCIKVQ